MFEYLMPLLVMPTYENTLLDQTNRAAVQGADRIRQAARRAAGASQSQGYNTVDAQFNYQYRAFGVPGLGFKRGLGEDLVIAPLCICHGLDGGARSCLRQLAGAGCGRDAWRSRFLRGRRFTPRRGSGASESACHRAFVHGPSPGHESAFAELFVAWQTDATQVQEV